MNKVSKFQQIITTATVKLRSALTAAQSSAFEAQLAALPKKIKQLNAEPYLFIFDQLLQKKDLIEYSLSALTSMLEENYIGYDLYERLAQTISPFTKDYSYTIVKLIHQIKQPHLSFIQLYFQIHSQIALPQDIHKRFKTQGYQWMARVFNFIQKHVDQFIMGIYSQFYPEELPKLMKPREQQMAIEKYVGLVMNEVIGQVQQTLGVAGQQRGKKGCCFLCRKPADYYCKDTKVSVCGVTCKKQHLQLLNTCPALNFQHSPQFKQQIQSILINNISVAKSPALSIDFLVAIYLYSDYRPSTVLPHLKAVTLPVIYQRIWMLYLSHYGKLGLSCEHILASCLVSDNYARQMASDYFVTLAQDKRILHVYNTFDRESECRLISFIINSIEDGKRSELVQNLVKTVFQYYSPNNKLPQDPERLLVRAFNQRELTHTTLHQIFGQNYISDVVRLVLRNQTQINKDKLSNLCKDEEICRHFLQKIVQNKKGAPVDELIREIFFFINIKVTDKVYRLFEILSEVYVPEHPFNQLNFFQYAYFIVMIVTEINNQSITKKPTIGQVLSRVESFSPELAKNHTKLIKDMFIRITKYPFSQQSRGILSHYPQRQLKSWKQIKPEEMIVMNWQKIYECALHYAMPTRVLYQICSMVEEDPAICQSFLRILVDQLELPQRDQFLLSAISNIIEAQPNSAGNLWKPILEEALSPSSSTTSSPSQTQQGKFNLPLLLQTTSRLTSDNFYQFTREFCQQLSIGSHPDLFLQLFRHNRGRIASISQLLIVNYEKCNNFYEKLQVIRLIGQMEQLQGELAVVLLQMLRTMPVLPITQGLLTQALLAIKWDQLPHSSQFWNILSQKCLQMKDQGRIVLLETRMKQAAHCQSYEPYLIQKTLNCHSKELISQQILRNLSKLEPYLDDINKDVLALFVLKDNIPTIIGHFQHFALINNSYQLILPTLTAETIEKLLPVIIDVFNRADTKALLMMDHFPIFLVNVLAIYPVQLMMETVDGYIELLENCNCHEDVVYVLMTLTNVAILAQEFKNIISSIKTKKEKSILDREEVCSWLEQVLHKLLSIAQQFQLNIPLRMQLKSAFKLPQLPSLLQSALILASIKTQLKPSVDAFTDLLMEVERVLDRQAHVQSQSKHTTKKDQIQKIKLSEANKDALKFGEMLVSQTLKYLKGGNQLSGEEKGRLRRVLLELLVQGFFEESSCSFRALAGTQLAQQVNDIFQLLK